MNDRLRKLFLGRIATINDKSGCWNWPTSLNSCGYGQFAGLRAHRVSYAVYIGPIPNDLCVCHRCDNPACVNPDHLFLGTHKRNMEDMARKGRHGSAKLTADDVRSIRASPLGNTAIAKQYGVSDVAVCLLRKYRTWKSVA